MGEFHKRSHILQLPLEHMDCLGDRTSC